MDELSADTQQAAGRVKKALAEIARLLARQAAREAFEQESRNAEEYPELPAEGP